MMIAHRIEISTKVNDTRSQVLLKKLQNFGVTEAKAIEIYTINKDFSQEDLKKIADILSNPVSQEYLIDDYSLKTPFDFALEIGFLPGVTDNVATTARESIEDLFKIKLSGEESVHTSQLILIKGTVSEEQIKEIGNSLANTLIQRIHIKAYDQFIKEKGMDVIVPKVHLLARPKADTINLDLTEEDLLKLGKEGILNKDGTRRGPLALDKESLDTIKDYFEKEGRNPKDIELESLAQTWSEHCKHTIFAAKIDENDDGLYKGFIKKATQDIRNAKGDNDFCVSVFKDNSGGIEFDENWIITDKAETHNSPSALDPFGGAITGIVGVNRDTVGFGMGAKPIINKYGFCVGNPDDTETVYRDKELKNPAISPKRILQGVVDGVNAGGNQSGIPTPQGFVYFNERYKGKPLIFVGTIGLIPKELNGEPSWEKKAQKGDLVVVAGGRVGQDGIHGATFSSEALTSGSPATAVQIGDPITQKKMSDAIIKEARQLNLYHSITDNGAGGISCSIAEMAKECGGCEVDLDKVPLKYPNLDPWKIWISESQERMTLAISPEKVEEFMKLMEKRGVEATVVGTFNDSGRCVVKLNGEKIMDLDMNFLHDGLPKKSLKTSYTKVQNPEPTFSQPQNMTETLLKMMSRPNISSFDFISRQYDHTVQAGAVLGPLHGKGKVNSPASITKPLIDSDKGVICSQALYPTYSDIDTYHMTACSIDTAVRNIIAIGGTLNHLALLDNFCWCDSNNPERLGQLKASAQACYDYAVEYGAPYISGKDSMFNDFQGYDKNGNPIKISVPPTLLISSIGVMKDVTKAVSLDVKFAEDLIYILGETSNELGASEYFLMNCDCHSPLDCHSREGGNLSPIGNTVPQVNADQSINLYRLFEKAIDQCLIASSLSPSHGGIGPVLAKKSIAGQLGIEIDLSKVPAKNITREDYLLFSETQSRFIATVAPQNQKAFEELFKEIPFGLIGKVRADQNFIIKGLDNKELISTTIQKLNENYRKTFKDW
ncbi:MAG: AIR synthase-related protein [Candidatus Gracilibacteria bacterium]|nr:AIR synthase-related protein [Candidatus Gracilibacteria bacterium]